MIRVFHIAQQDEWQHALEVGSYFPSQPVDCAFIHLSFPNQLLWVANFLFKGRTDLLLLEFSKEALGEKLVVEPSEGDEFPHLYRAILPSEVLAVRPFKPGPDGRFTSI